MCSVILRVSEARDLGDVNRFAFYEHMKPYLAAPPDVLRCDQKNLREYSVPNVCGVIITTNHKTDGIYLPADDRRHYVAWSDATKEDFAPEYWTSLYRWYEDEGYWNVAAYLMQIDLARFNAKAPPHKTVAFHAIVDSNRSAGRRRVSGYLGRNRKGRPTSERYHHPNAGICRHGRFPVLGPGPQKSSGNSIPPGNSRIRASQE